MTNERYVSNINYYFLFFIQKRLSHDLQLYFYFLKSIYWEDHASSLADTFVVPITSSFDKIHTQILSLPTNIEENATNIDRLKCYRRLSVHPPKDSHEKVNKQKQLSFTNHIGQSMFPSLDNFIHSLGQRKSISGSIRAWSLDESYSGINDTTTNQFFNSNIIYHMKGNRWCENINRCHKSNNIMWNVSIRDGTYWQSCHDPDCRLASFRGEKRLLPNEIIADINGVILDFELETNGELAKILEQADEKFCMDPTTSKSKANNKTYYDDQDFDAALQVALLENPNMFP